MGKLKECTKVMNGKDMKVKSFTMAVDKTNWLWKRAYDALLENWQLWEYKDICDEEDLFVTFKDGKVTSVWMWANELIDDDYGVDKFTMNKWLLDVVFNGI